MNPIEMLGGDRVWAIAKARPDIPFVLRESNIMSAADHGAVQRGIAAHPNVTAAPYTTKRTWVPSERVTTTGSPTLSAASR